LKATKTSTVHPAKMRKREECAETAKPDGIEGRLEMAHTAQWWWSKYDMPYSPNAVACVTGKDG
jgi:hypothetical protein